MVYVIHIHNLHTHNLSLHTQSTYTFFIKRSLHSMCMTYTIPKISLYIHNVYVDCVCRERLYMCMTYTIPKILSFYIHNDLRWKQASNRQTQKLRRSSLSSRLQIDACVLCVRNLEWKGGSEAGGEKKRKRSMLHILYVRMCVRICACMCVSVRASARTCTWVFLSVLNVYVLCQIVVCLAFVFDKCVRGYIFV